MSWLYSTKTLLFVSLLICTLASGYNIDSKRTRIKTNGDLSVDISIYGDYSVNVDGTSWLRSAPTFFNANNKTYITSGGGLKLNGSMTSYGVDAIGSYNMTSLRYVIADGKSSSLVSANIMVYHDLPIVIFDQYFNDGLKDTKGNSVEGTCSGFPGFMLEGPPNLFGYLSYGGTMFGDTNKQMGTWYYQSTTINDGTAGGPLAIFDRHGNTIVWSPFNNFMSASFYHDRDYGGNFYGGIMGGVSDIPAGHSQKFIMYYASGINKAFEGWGRVLRKYYGKSPDIQNKDPSLNFLGYWTANELDQQLDLFVQGDYYFYHTEGDQKYDATLLDVKNYADRMNIPYRYFQFDSWWYYKSMLGGVKTWTARPDIFPEGMQEVHEKLRVPLVGHNGYWSADTSYAKQNGGKYEFIVEKSKALPLTMEFWLDLFTEAKKWGLMTYEQDWLNVQFAGLEALLNNLTLGDDWLNTMGKAAQNKSLFIQYCMANPRHAMKALEIPAVTHARVSKDYLPGNDQWKIGISSIFAAAMGVSPYKDSFWTTEKQPGNTYNLTEPNWKLQSIVSTLSRGPVAVGDMVGGTSVDVLMKCCNSAGLILKPGFPARAIDAQILQAAFGDTGGPEGEVWVSYTEVNGLSFANLLGVDIQNGTSYIVYPNLLGMYTNNETLYAIPYDEPEGWVTFSSLYGITFDDKFKPNRPALYHISPNIPGWFMTTIFGEMDKWVPMSPKRVTGVSWNSSDVTASLQGAPNETFTLWFMYKSKVDSVTCHLTDQGLGTFRMSGTGGYATCAE